MTMCHGKVEMRQRFRISIGFDRTDSTVRQQQVTLVEVQGRCFIYLFIYLFIYYMICTHVKSFTVTVKNRKCRKVTCHSRKARPYRADLSCFFLNVPVVVVKAEMAVLLILFHTTVTRGQH